MTTGRIDRILLGLGALLILISSYQLFFAGQKQSQGLKLATLSSTLSVVKTKNALSLDWRDASSGNDLTENQLIYTDNSSSAEVVFNEGHSLTIGESSLIKLRADRNNDGLDISKGFIRAKLEGKKPLKVQLNGEDYELSGEGADVQINLQNNKGEIGVLSGEVSVVSDGVKEKLDVKNALEINGDKVLKKTIYFSETTPVKNATVYILSSPEEVQFTWEPKEEAEIILSKHLSFEHATHHPGNSGISMPFSPGLYYYRIESKKGTSLISSFKVVQEKAPQVLRPIDGEKVEVLEGQSEDVLVQWKAIPGLKYKLEWDTGKISSTEISGGSKLISVKDSEILNWRVKVSDPARENALWSEWQKLQIRHIAFPDLPSELAPHEVEYQTYERPDLKVDLSWVSSFPVNLEIKDPQGKVAAQKISENKFQYHATSAGAYFWRVQSFDNFMRKSEWSEWKTFLIEDLSQEIASSGIQRIQLKKPDQSVTFSWKSNEGSVSIFELAKDSGFTTLIKKTESKKDSVQVSIPVTGTFYWRSRQYLPDGTLNVSEPKRVIIEPVPAPEKPDKLPDIEVPLQELPVKTSFLRSVSNFLLPEAHADESKGIIKVDLPATEEAKAFVVRIYRDKELTDLVFEKQITSKTFQWNHAEAGTFYWQYAVVDFWDRTSLFSDPATLTVKHEIIPAPSKPKLLSPIRAKEVEMKTLTFAFSETEFTEKYTLEIASDKSFDKPLYKKGLIKNRHVYSGQELSPGLYFWRVSAENSKSAPVQSNTGRFVIAPPVEKTIIADFPPVKTVEEIKEWKSRAFIGWNPSLDSYTFKDGETGKISGTALMGFSVAGTFFQENSVFSAELLRQTGKVFEGKSYLFQRALIDGVKTWHRSSFHRFGAGLGIGQVSAQGYQIAESGVTTKAVSGLVYGPVLRDYFAIHKNWELQTKVMYLLGDVKQIDFSSDVITRWKNYLFSAGAGYAVRTYETSSGNQSSIKLSLGIGKEF